MESITSNRVIFLPCNYRIVVDCWRFRIACRSDKQRVSSNRVINDSSTAFQVRVLGNIPIRITQTVSMEYVFAYKNWFCPRVRSHQSVYVRNFLIAYRMMYHFRVNESDDKSQENNHLRRLLMKYRVSITFKVNLLAVYKWRQTFRFLPFFVTPFVLAISWYWSNVHVITFVCSTRVH